MNDVLLVVAAFGLGVAVGILNNLVWRWVSGRSPGDATGPQGGLPDASAATAVQFIIRIALSLGALYAAYVLFEASSVAILATLGGLLLMRYVLLWKALRAGETRGAADGGQERARKAPGETESRSPRER